eukprot:TRINITY_DN3594_c0_g1_i1.p1 TRINITY_DN3594_c0_g1~~TRINITY_DN3594_c0_g1_i1.p1  ORF type:complete len:205 (-),score=35.06 TRINITY_DN3594_c0_g1_i1:375-989(-)
MLLFNSIQDDYCSAALALENASSTAAHIMGRVTNTDRSVSWDRVRLHRGAEIVVDSVEQKRQPSSYIHDGGRKYDDDPRLENDDDADGGVESNTNINMGGGAEEEEGSSKVREHHHKDEVYGNGDVYTTTTNTRILASYKNINKKKRSDIHSYNQVWLVMVPMLAPALIIVLIAVWCVRKKMIKCWRRITHRALSRRQQQRAAV